jgi:hypothetical protein
MSDVERPGQNPDQPPARNMADIARLFLDGARPMPASAAPKRIPPGARRDTAPSAPPQAPSAAPLDPAAVRLAVAGVWGQEGWPALTAAAAALAAEASTTVAVLGLVGNQFVIDVIGADSPADLPQVRIDASAGAVDLQIARALFTLRAAVGTWIVAAPPAGTPGFASLAGRLSQWLVVCPTDNDGLVAVYQQLKRAAAIPGARALQAFMVTDDAAQAATVHGRLRRAAKEFLGAELSLAGIGAPVAARRVAAFPTTHDGPLWPAVLDELAPAPEADLEPEASPAATDLPSLEENVPPTSVEDAVDRVAASAQHVVHAAQAAFDHLAHVLDPEERAALGADFEPVESTRIARPRTQPAAPASARPSPHVAAPAAATATVVSRKPAPADLTDGTLVLRAFDLLDEEAADRDAQWQAIERSIRDFVPGAHLLDARAPMAWATESTLAVDAEGRLHVWTLFRDGATWFALREWATEHRALLALTRRDLRLDLDAEVAVHIVMPLNGAPGDAVSRAGGRLVSWYRLRAVQWAGRRGAIVVPAH